MATEFRVWKCSCQLNRRGRNCFRKCLRRLSTYTNESFVMSDQWEMYFAPVDEEPAAILVDLGLAESIPDDDRPMLLWMWLQMQSPDENGFASEEEEPQLVTIEDAFIDAVELTTGAAFVGRVTTCGRREFYFYAKSDEGFEDTIAEAMEPFEGYEYETGVQEDDEWRQYREVLLPGPEDSQQIFNRHVIENLIESGDSLTTPRPVDHYASFPTKADRAAFIKAVTDAGYEVVSEKYNKEPDCETPFSVGLQRVSAVEFDIIDEMTFELFDLAMENNGDYEGWGSPVVTGG